MPNPGLPLPEWMQEFDAEDDLFQTIALLMDHHEVRRFHFALVTREERRMLSRRWRAVMLLYEGFEVNEIHQMTGVAKGTISDVRKLIINEPKADEVCRKFYERLRDSRNKLDK